MHFFLSIRWCDGQVKFKNWLGVGRWTTVYTSFSRFMSRREESADGRDTRAAKSGAVAIRCSQSSDCGCVWEPEGENLCYLLQNRWPENFEKDTTVCSDRFETMRADYHSCTRPMRASPLLCRVHRVAWHQHRRPHHFDHNRALSRFQGKFVHVCQTRNLDHRWWCQKFLFGRVQKPCFRSSLHSRRQNKHVFSWAKFGPKWSANWKKNKFVPSHRTRRRWEQSRAPWPSGQSMFWRCRRNYWRLRTNKTSLTNRNSSPRWE